MLARVTYLACTTIAVARIGTAAYAQQPTSTPAPAPSTPSTAMPPQSSTMPTQATPAQPSTDAMAQQPHDSIEEHIDPKLAAEAKISKDSAEHIALAKVPGATIKSVELEREHGKLVYSFDLMVPNKSGVEEVNVNAMNGAIVSKFHESAKTERHEEKQERKSDSAAKAKP